METDPVSSVREVIAEALDVPLERVTDSSSMETLSEWDSFGHLSILVALEKQFGEKTKGIPGFGKATSVAKITALLKEHHLI